jgi:hypothetical protein
MLGQLSCCQRSHPANMSIQKYSLVKRREMVLPIFLPFLEENGYENTSVPKYSAAVRNTSCRNERQHDTEYI